MIQRLPPLPKQLPRLIKILNHHQRVQKIIKLILIQTATPAIPQPRNQTKIKRKRLKRKRKLTQIKATQSLVQILNLSPLIVSQIQVLTILRSHLINHQNHLRHLKHKSNRINNHHPNLTNKPLLKPQNLQIKLTNHLNKQNNHQIRHKINQTKVLEKNQINLQNHSPTKMIITRNHQALMLLRRRLIKLLKRIRNGKMIVIQIQTLTLIQITHQMIMTINRWNIEKTSTKSIIITTKKLTKDNSQIMIHHQVTLTGIIVMDLSLIMTMIFHNTLTGMTIIKELIFQISKETLTHPLVLTVTKIKDPSNRVLAIATERIS